MINVFQTHPRYRVFKLLVGVLQTISVSVLSLYVSTVFANTIPDIFTDPQVGNLRTYENSFNQTELIDPMSGQLTLQYKDIVIPGNNGLDLIATRTYKSLQSHHSAGNVTTSGGIAVLLHGVAYDARPWASALGAGWDMHFGRIYTSRLEGTQQADCRRGEAFGIVNPVLEHADGSRHTMYNATGNDYAFISKERWVMKCEANGKVLVYSPNGLTYTFGYFTQKTFGDNQGGSYAAYHATEISDLNGNKIRIDYHQSTNQGLIHKAYFEGQESKGIEFTYIEQGKPGKYLLSQISANGQTWQYSYAASPRTENDFYFLTQAKPPVGNAFEFAYNVGSESPGAHTLTGITTPGGATVRYNYGYMTWDFIRVGGSLVASVTSAVITNKTVSGSGTANGSWVFAYDTNEIESATTITNPDLSKIEYRYFAKRQSAGEVGVWALGLMRSKKYLDPNNQILRHEEYSWAKQEISNQNVWRDLNTKDDYVYFPLLTQKKITQDQKTYTTTQSNFSDYGQASTITESGTENRTTQLTYQNLTNLTVGQWKLNLIKTQTTSNVQGQKTFNYDDIGQLISSDIYGVTEHFTRCSNGETALHTNPNGNKTQYDCNAYQNGIPKVERLAHGSADEVVITRAVNHTGTLESETRNSKITRYTYDNLNRIVGIHTPRTDDSNISIAWNAAGTQRTLTRGTYTHLQTFDGLGRLIANKDEPD